MIERRSDDPLRTLAREAASEALDRRHRGQLTEVAVVALIVALAVVLPLSLLLLSQSRDAARQNSLFNCRALIKPLANIEAGFIASDAIDRRGSLTRAQRAEVIQGFDRLFPPGFIRQATHAQQTLDGYTIAFWQGPASRHGPFAGREPLLAQVNDLEHVNCAATR